MAIRVEAGAIVVKVKGHERYLYKGAFLPTGVEPEEVKRLKAIGLVKEVKVETAPQPDPEKAAAEKAAAEKAAAEKAAAEKAAAEKAAAEKASGKK